MLTPGKLHISIIGQSDNGKKKLTTRKMALPVVVLESGSQDGDAPEAYTPELWEQALMAIGDLTSLTTDKKNNIVSAINELNKSGSKTISGFKSTTKTSSGTLLGDVNGDGIIDTTDLIALQRYLDGTVTDIDTEAADLNGDGVVDAADFELLQKLFETMHSGQVIARIKITYTDGTSDTIYEWVDATDKGEKGEKGDTGAAGKDGTNGKDGKTPVRGIDYWTDEDQESIAQQAAALVIANLGTPVFGRVDENNNISLSADLPEGKYMLKYVQSDGSVIEIGSLTVGEVETIINWIPLSTDTDGSIFNGKGWNTGYRVSSSGEIKELAGYELTGFIPFTKGDVLRGNEGIIGLLINNGNASLTGYNAISLYDNDKTFIANIGLGRNSSTVPPGVTFFEDDSFVFDSAANDNVTNEVAYVRVTTSGITASSILTVNQEIV